MNVNQDMIRWVGQLNILADKEEVMFRPNRNVWRAKLLDVSNVDVVLGYYKRCIHICPDPIPESE